MPLSPGNKLGPYEILAALGAGGMGEVYKARDTRLDRIVAIKVLPSGKVADPERRRRFVQEAKAASALNHPNIVILYDMACDNGIDFMVMEYVAGKTLDQAVSNKGLRTRETLKYAIQIADALAKAHAAGIVHRDLKPGNVMVTDEGQVKVLDFGLAKLTERPVGAGEATLTARQDTEEGAILGTIAYMSPEQAEGPPVDSLKWKRDRVSRGHSLGIVWEEEVVELRIPSCALSRRRLFARNGLLTSPARDRWARSSYFRDLLQFSIASTPLWS